MFKIVSFGVVPTYLALEHFSWLWWVGYAIFLVAYRSVNRARANNAAAFNIVMAQATIITLDRNEMRRVKSYARKMLCVFEGDPGAVFENELQELAHFALAMNDMGIEPAVPSMHWFEPRDPSYVPPEYVISHAMKIVTAKIGSAAQAHEPR